MADEPISALTQIAAPTGTPPYPTAFTNPSTGAMLEILDTTNTSMASTGTNSRIPPGHLLMGFLAAGSNVTLTETSGIVTIAASGGGGMSVGSAVSGGSNHATLVEDGSGNLAALAIGSTGQVLTVVSGAPAWANAAVGMTVGNPVSGGTDYSVLCEDMNGNLQANGNLTFNGTDTILMQQTASTTSAPSNIGFGSNTAGNMCQFQFDTSNCWRNAFGNVPQICAYWGLYVYGNTGTSAANVPLVSTSGFIATTCPSMQVVGTNSGANVFVVQGASSQTGDLQEWISSGASVLTRVRNDGSIALPTLADSSAVNSSLYFSSTSSKLCYKDASGGLHVTS